MVDCCAPLCAINAYFKEENNEYTVQELKTYKEHTSIFGNLWIDLHQEYGMKNYIHFIVSGHIYKYMKEWKNLYRFSQQGWESLNSLIKHFFFLMNQQRRWQKYKQKPIDPYCKAISTSASMAFWTG